MSSTDTIKRVFPNEYITQFTKSKNGKITIYLTTNAIEVFQNSRSGIIPKI